MKKKVLLIAFYYPSLPGIRSVGKLLKKKYEVNYLFFMDVPPFLIYSEGWILKNFKKENFLDFCTKFDYILITSTSVDKKFTFYLSDLLKKSLPSIKIIIGGSLGITEPEECLKHSDFVCIWNSYKLLDFLDFLEGKTLENNILVNFRARDKKIKTAIQSPPTYDEMPLPDYSRKNNFFYTKKQIFKSENYDFSFFFCETSQGCVYDCSFCTQSIYRKIKKINNLSLVLKSTPKKLISRLIHIKKNNTFGYGIFISDDDFFVYSKNEINQFVKGYNRFVDLPLVIQADIRSPGFLNKFEELSSLKAYTELYIGLQSGSEEFCLHVYNRRQSNENFVYYHNQMKAILKNKKNFRICYQIIYANPLESKEDIVKTINLMLKLGGAKYRLNSYSPIPNTNLGNRMKGYYLNINNFLYPDIATFLKNGFYYFFLFFIDFMNRNRLGRFLPKELKPNLLTEFMNNKFFSRIFYYYITKKIKKNLGADQKKEINQIRAKK